MCQAIVDMQERSKNEARENIARNLLSDGTLSIEKISEVSELPLNRVKEISESLRASA